MDLHLPQLSDLDFEKVKEIYFLMGLQKEKRIKKMMIDLFPHLLKPDCKKENQLFFLYQDLNRI